MKRLLLLALFLAGCAHSRAPKAVGTPALEGEWQLVDAKCASGALGSLGANIAVGIHTRATDERYIVDEAGAFTWRVRERNGPGASQDAYCENIFTGTFSADGHVIHDSGAKFVSRTGVGGYECYKLHDAPQMGQRPSDHTYELGAKGMVIHHKSPVARVQGQEKTYQGCENGSELLFVFERP